MIDLTIREPGIYDIPIAAYHSQICDAPSLSSTALRKIRLRSLEHYWETSDINPNGTPEPRTTALNFGNAAHSLLLEGELSPDQYSIQPFLGPYNRNEPGWKAGEKKAWKQEQEAAGLIVVDYVSAATIFRMRDRLHAHPLIRDGLFRGQIERSLFWRAPMSDHFWLKARPDVVPHDNLLADYKAVADASPRAVNQSILKYGYHMQIAMMVDGIMETTGHIIEHAALVCQEKTPPFTVAVYPLSEHFINAGRAEYQHAFKLFLEAYDSGVWSGYFEDTQFVPGWKHDELEAEGLI